MSLRVEMVPAAVVVPAARFATLRTTVAVVVIDPPSDTRMPSRVARAPVGVEELESGFPVAFAGVKFTPGEWLYADEDGIVTSARSLL